MNSKLRIAFIYHKDNTFLTENHFDNTCYNFFIKAFKRNPKLTVINFPTGDKFDCVELKNDFDAIVLWENSPFGMPKKIIGINDLKIPIICRIGDPSGAKKSRKFHEEWNINCYFDFFSERFFYQLYPSDFQYRTIFYGLEAQLYENLTPFSQRIKDRILVTGSPRYDYIKSLDSKKIKNFFYDDNHIDSKKKLISVAMSRWTKNDEVWMSELIKFSNKSNFEIIIKYHPRYKINPEDTPFKIEYINQKCSNQNFILTPDLVIADVLVSSDVVISDFSSIVSETILMDKPVIMVNFLKQKLSPELHYDNYQDKKIAGALYTEDYNDVEKFLIEILDQNKHLELEKGRKEIASLINYKHDGLATQRIFELLLGTSF